MIAILEASLREAKEINSLEAEISSMLSETTERNALVAELERLAADREALRRAQAALGNLDREVQGKVDGGAFAAAAGATAALERILNRAGLPTNLKPAQRVLEFLEGKYLAEKRLGEDSKRRIINLFAKITGNNPWRPTRAVTWSITSGLWSV